MTRARDPCASSSGAVLALATSSDGRHPPENIIDGNSNTFWITTGLFPQEFIISMSSLQKIGRLAIESSQVRHLRIEVSTTKEPSNFEACMERELEHVDGHFHNEEIDLSGVQAIHLRFVISSGYDHFVAVRSVSAESV